MNREGRAKGPEPSRKGVLVISHKSGLKAGEQGNGGLSSYLTVVKWGLLRPLVLQGQGRGGGGHELRPKHSPCMAVPTALGFPGGKDPSYSLRLLSVLFLRPCLISKGLPHPDLHRDTD